MTLTTPNVHAPEFNPGLTWLNTSRPLSLQDLRGKVVVLDFWTYGCINCMHVIPDLKKLERKYGDKLAVIGIHSPKFKNEQNLDTLRDIIRRYDLHHPIAQDTSFTMWQQYAVRAWPTLVVIDPAGGVVGAVAGEGHYDTLDQVIGGLLDKYAASINSTPLPMATEGASGTLLAYPGKVAASRDRVAIADTGHHRILVTDNNGKVQQVLGTGEPGRVDGPADIARFHSPQGVALAGTDLYIADTGNHAIRHVDLRNGEVTTLAGTGERVWQVTGEFLARETGLASPWDISFTASCLYIAMAGTHQIWRMDLDRERIGPFAGNGREDIVDGAAFDAAFSQPSGLCLMGHTLYVADAEDSAVRTVDTRSGQVHTLVGHGLFDFGDQDGPFASALLQHVLGVAAWDENVVYIADTYNHKIKALMLNERTVVTVAGTGLPGEGCGRALEAGLNEPGGLAVHEGFVLIADTNNHRIVRYDPHEQLLQEWPVNL